MARVHVCLLSIACVVVFLASVAAAGDVNVWTSSGTDASVSSDSILPGATLYAEQAVRAQLQVQSGTLSGASISIVPGAAIGEREGGEPALYFHWASGPGTATWTAIGPMSPSSPSMFVELSPAAATTTVTAAIGVSRSISDPIFTTDAATRTVTLTLNVPAGALTGYTGMGLNAITDWGLPDGLSITGFSNVTNTAGFASGGNGFFFNNLVDLGTLSGAYTFSADVAFQRSGPLSQVAYGDLYFKPGAQVHYGTASGGSTTGTSTVLSTGGNTVTASAANSVNWNATTETGASGLELQTIAAQANGDVVVSGIQVTKDKRSVFGVSTQYEFGCDVTGSNIVAGTLTTPNSMVYDLVGEDGGEDFEFNFMTAGESGLTDLDLVNGTYTITLWDARGNQTVKTVSLSGDYPAEIPTIDQAAMDTANPRPTITWTAPGSSIDVTYLEVYDDQEYEQQKMLFKGVNDMTDTTWTPAEDLHLGGFYVTAGFAAGQIYTQGGVEYVAAHVSSLDSYINVTPTPEPATMGLLALGGLAMLLRVRRSRARV